MDLINDTIEKSRYKFDPLFTSVCLYIIKELNKCAPEHKERGLNKCFMMQQWLYKVGKKSKLDIPSYWYKLGVVVDPEYIILATRGIIRFKWEDDCPGCQIEEECCCKDNPHNNNYKLVEEKLKWLLI